MIVSSGLAQDFGPAPTIALLGDSTTRVSYMPLGLGWGYQLGVITGRAVVNWGDDGAVSADFITGGSFPPTLWLDDAIDYYIVRFGYNETVAATHLTNMGLILDAIDTVSGTAILVTDYGVDYPTYYTSNRNPTIETYNANTRTLSTSRSITLVDLYNDGFETTGPEFRVRQGSVIGSDITNPLTWGPTSSLDGDGSGGADDPAWYTNIHPGRGGCASIAAAVAGAIS